MLGLNQMFSRKKTSVIKYFVPVIWALIAFPAGADVCGKNDSWCSFKWQQATAKEVVEFMSDYDIKDPALALDIKGNTVYHRVASNPDPAVFQALIKINPNINTRNGYREVGYALLHAVALKNPNPAVLMVLLNAGADVNLRDYWGNTPLHWAAMANPNPVVLALLLLAGADVNIKAVPEGDILSAQGMIHTLSQGKVPLQAAKISPRQKNKKEIIAVLEKRGDIAQKSFAVAEKIMQKYTP